MATKFFNLASSLGLKQSLPTELLAETREDDVTLYAKKTIILPFIDSRVCGVSLPRKSHSTHLRSLMNTILPSARHSRLWLLGSILATVTWSGSMVAQDKELATNANGNFEVGPQYSLARELTDLGAAKGRSFEFSMKLAESNIFPGTDKTLDPTKDVRVERKVFVYVPASYVDGTKAPVLVIHDGPGQLNLVKNALDNLTGSTDPYRKLPAFIVVAIQNGGNDSKGSERGLEYDTMSDRLARFVEEEVFPAVLSNADIRAAYPNIAITSDPWGRAVLGCSSGGAAALTMGWFRPDLFRRLITYSGTFVDQQDDDAAEEAAYPLGAWEYHSSMKLIENTEKKPLKIFTHVAEFDLQLTGPGRTHHDWIEANRRTADSLKKMGYDYRFVFSKESKHCQRDIFDHTLADTLIWAWHGYEPNNQ